jgi:ABC-2 type transport system permease protein
MRLSKAWTIASRDFKIFTKQKNVWYSIIIFPIITSVIFPVVLSQTINRANSIPVATISNLLNTFSFFLVIGAAFAPLGIAAYSIVGEKVEKSLEPLLATPITDGEILLGKAISALVPTLVAMYIGAAIFMTGMDIVTYTKLGYYYFPNLTIASVTLILMPIASVMSILFSIIVSSRVNDVRSANSYGILMYFPFLGIFLASETGIITIDVNTILIISGIILAVDVALFFLSTKTFRREEILTKWK